jgi:hypothetical protein
MLSVVPCKMATFHFRRVLSFILFLIFAFVLCGAIQKVLKNAKGTSYGISYNDIITFPAFTVCPFNLTKEKFSNLSFFEGFEKNPWITAEYRENFNFPLQ